MERDRIVNLLNEFPNQVVKSDAILMIAEIINLGALRYQINSLRSDYHDLHIDNMVNVGYSLLTGGQENMPRWPNFCGLMEDILTVNSWVVNRKGNSTRLTLTETRLLIATLENQGSFIPFQSLLHIFNCVPKRKWEWNRVNTTISRFRAKIEPQHDRSNIRIDYHKGIGYFFNPDE